MEPGPRPLRAEGNHEAGTGKITSMKRNSRERTECAAHKTKTEMDRVQSEEQERSGPAAETRTKSENR
jgi:hypothetical protein